MSWAERTHRVKEQVLKTTFNPGRPAKSVQFETLKVQHFLASADLQYCEAKWLAARDKLEIYGHDWPLKSNHTPEWYKFLSGRDTSQVECFKLIFRNSDDIREDIRLVWELNRLVWLIPIAIYARHSGDEEANAYVVKAVKDFLDTDRVGFGARWGSAIEAAYQALSLLLLKSILEKEFGEPNFVSSLDMAITTRQKFMQRFPSLYSSANNHRLAELVALIILGSNSTPRDPKLERLSGELERRTFEQFDSEGMNSELAFDYHLSSFDLLIATLEFANSNFLSESLRKRIEKISETTQNIYQLSGVWPIIGDSDMASFLASVVPYGLKAEWLSNFSNSVTSDQHFNFLSFQKSGYSMIVDKGGNDELFLVVDHGSIGFGEIAGHGHADTLAIWLWVNQQPWLVEAGTYSYHSSDKFRDFLRSSKMHNTISINNSSTSHPSGPFLWFAKNRAAGKLEAQSQKDGKFSLELSAVIPNLSHRQAPYLHRRQVDLSDKELQIRDHLTYESKAFFSAHFILAPGFELERGATVGEVVFKDSAGSKILFKYDPLLSTSRTDRVKTSDSYGNLQESCRISLETETSPHNSQQSVTIILSPSKKS